MLHRIRDILTDEWQSEARIAHAAYPGWADSEIGDIQWDDLIYTLNNLRRAGYATLQSGGMWKRAAEQEEPLAIAQAAEELGPYQTIDAGALARAHIERLESALRATIVAIDAITENEISYGECRYCGAAQYPADENGAPLSDDGQQSAYCYATDHAPACPSAILDTLSGTVRAALKGQAAEE